MEYRTAMLNVNMVGKEAHSVSWGALSDGS